MTPVKNLFLTSLLSVLLAFGACQDPRNVSGLIYLAKTVIELIDTFSEKSDFFTQRVRKVTAMTTSSIQANKDVGDIAKFWEKQWTDIHTRFDELDAHLQAINIKSLEYFQEMDNNNAMISDEEQRKQDAAKNQEIKAKWQQEFQKAVNSLNNARQMLKEGDDFMYLLRNEVLRSAVSQSIVSLNQISTQAISLSASIKSFEQSAKNIFKT